MSILSPSSNLSKDQPTKDKEDFLFQKGLSQSEVSEALRRALAGPPEPVRESPAVVVAGFGPSVPWMKSGKCFERLWYFVVSFYDIFVDERCHCDTFVRCVAHVPGNRW